MKRIIITAFVAICINLETNAQNCLTGKLDTRVAANLQTGLSDFLSNNITSVEKIRDIKFETPPFPPSDVMYLKMTADSIPVQVYNPTHAKGLPIVISYHLGGFVTPGLSSMKYDFWR